MERGQSARPGSRRPVPVLAALLFPFRGPPSARRGRGWRRLGRLLGNLRELEERRLLAHYPWEEDLLHWSRDGLLHGEVAPPSDGRRRGVTSGGWCPGAPRRPGR